MKPDYIIVGLGNPGAQYERTRHNVGFRALQLLADEFASDNEWKESQKFLGAIVEAKIGTDSVMLIRPNTYMNLSANSVHKIIDYYKLDPATKLIVICDDIDLPLGEVRYRKSGGPGTHNGLRSIHEVFGDGVKRIKIGIGTPTHGEDLAAWVLSIPSLEDEKVLSASENQIIDLVKENLSL